MRADLLTMALAVAVLVEEREGAAVLLERLRRVAGQSTCDYAMATAARHLGAAAALLRKPDEARTYYEQALDAAAKIRFRPEVALTHLQLAELLMDHYPEEQAKAQQHLDFAISEFRAMKMQPALERALRHKGILKA